MDRPIDFQKLARRFDGPDIQAVALLGSHARGDAGPFSDIDFLCLVAEGGEDRAGPGSHLIDGRLVTVSSAALSTVERWFTEPNEVVAAIAGLRRVKPLLDADNQIARLKERALAFTWDAAMQERANRYAGEQMVGWIEEALKGLEGLRRDDVGRMLNARFGLSWGLSHVMQVYRGVLIEGDNHFYEAMVEVMGRDSEWARLRAAAYGLVVDGRNPPTLYQSVIAGLRLYELTAEMLAGALSPDHRDMTMETAECIRRELSR